MLTFTAARTAKKIKKKLSTNNVSCSDEQIVREAYLVELLDRSHSAKFNRNTKMRLSHLWFHISGFSMTPNKVNNER